MASNFYPSQGSPYRQSPQSRSINRSNTSPDLVGIDEEDHSSPSYNQANSHTNRQWLTANNNVSQSAPPTPRKVNSEFKSPSFTDRGRPSPGVNMGLPRKLTRRAAGSSSSLTPSGEEWNEVDGGGARKKMRYTKEEEMVEEVDNFDPMEAIHVFDSKCQLEDEWDKIQEQMVAFLKNYAKETLEHAYENIIQVNYLFTTMNKQAQEDLLAGVAAIEKEEAEHERARKIITDFSEEMKRAAEVLSRFGDHGNPLKALMAKREGGTGGA
ncbi:hypothetical protein I302_105330 [Kwoniella bestiolae CBS 10118]|uniref:Uncharacterized protein n=1 Tax=Kwoniella bestiolae CBS 10118 TaxID=1296100 RepID=A0A1B9FST4_9TREE|nr:hypothetical protein I302_08616 [Kwoniella bestiolae CBS 10118]OCF21837.1 hypothetical protein I302_08616 [Kwoniella bestiolae CBS 10118]